MTQDVVEESAMQMQKSVRIRIDNYLMILVNY